MPIAYWMGTSFLLSASSFRSSDCNMQLRLMAVRRRKQVVRPTSFERDCITIAAELWHLLRQCANQTTFPSQQCGEWV